MKNNQINNFKKIIILLLGINLFCYLTAQEIVISFDEKGKIDFIDSKMGEKLSLFKEYENFQEARLLQLPDSSYALEIYYKPGNQFLKARILLNTNEVIDLKHRVMSELNQKSPEISFNQEGRLKFIIDAMLLSLGYYGWAMQAALDIDDAKLGVATYMLVGGAGFYLPYTYTSNINVTDAAATMSHYLGTRGIIHGIYLSLLINKKPSERAIWSSGMLASIAEFGGGFSIANKLNISTGASEVIGITGDFGLFAGFGTAHILDLLDNKNQQGTAAFILLGSGAGYVAGKLISDHQTYTRGDAYVYKSAGFLGAYIPLALVDAFEPENSKVYTASSIIGLTIGAKMGDYLVKRRDFTAAQGRLVFLSEIAGGLLGLGTAYLISAEGRDNSTLYLASSSIGASAGFWLMYKKFREKAQMKETNLSLEINFSPEILLIEFNKKNINPIQPVLRTFLSANYIF